MPLLYGQTYDLCAYAKPHSGHPYFKKGHIDFLANGDWGIFLKAVPLTSKINLYTGVYHGLIDWGYRLSRAGESTGSAEGAFIYYFPVFINLFDYAFGHKGRQDDDIPPPLHSIHFRTYLGLSFDYVPDAENNDYFNMNRLSSSIAGVTSGLVYSDYANVITHNGMATMLGESIILYNNAKKRESLSFNIFYWQGLINLLSVDVNYAVDGTNYHTRLYSRASSIDLALAYNIPINYKQWFSKKKHKDDNKATKN